MPVTLRHVERFEITLGTGTTSDTHTLTTTLLDTSKAFLLYGWRSAHGDADTQYGSVRITSTTQLTAARSDSDGPITFIGYVCEFTEGVAVIRGTTTLSSGPSDTDVSAVITDLSKAWVRAHQRNQDGGGTIAEDDFSSAELVDDGGVETVRVHREAAGGVNDECDWEAVQFDECSVQRGTVTLASGATSDTLSITAVDQSRAFVLCGFDQEGISGGDGRMDILLPRVRLTADDTVTVDRVSSGAAVNVRVQVIEFSEASGIAVQKVTSSFAAADGQNDHTLTTLSGLDKAAALCSVNGSTGKAAYDADDIAGEAFFTPDLTSTTNLQLKRNSTNDAADVEAYVIDFEPAGGGAVVGLATEIDTAFAVTATKAKAVGVAPEIDSALPVSSRRALEVGLARELDSAFGVVGELTSAAEDVWSKEDRVLCLVASPFDETIETNFSGPPVPHGMRAHGNALRGWTATGAETHVYLSDVGYTSKPTDDPPSQYFDARLVSSFNYQVRLFQGDEPSGRSKPGLGDIRLGNGDGGLDDFLMLGWPGRTLRLYEGRKPAAFSTFVLRAVMTTDGLNWTEGEVSMRLRDQQGLFARNIVADFYSGDGALGGDATVAGVARPQAYGELFNIEPILINAGLLILQFHDRQAEAVVAVRDRGIALALDTAVGTNGDVADYDALAAATVAAGKYATCLALGLIRLGSSPGGRVTADVKGDAQGGYVDTAGTIVRRIVTTRMGAASLSDPDDLDIGAFALLETDQPASIGIYLGTERRLVDEFLDQIMSSVGGFWDMTLLGKLRPAILKAPAGTAADTLTVADIADKPQLQRSGIRPSALRRVGYQRMWTVQSADELAEGVTAANRALYSREFRFALASDQGVATKVKLAREVETPGLFVSQADADTEAGRLQAFYGEDLSRYSVSVKRNEFLRRLNDVIDVEGLDRFGFAATQKFRLVGIQANAKSGQVIWELLG